MLEMLHTRNKKFRFISPPVAVKRIVIISGPECPAAPAESILASLRPSTAGGAGHLRHCSGTGGDFRGSLDSIGHGLLVSTLGIGVTCTVTLQDPDPDPIVDVESS